MNIALLSDLHLSMDRMPPPATDADVFVVAGDLGRPAAAMEWMAALGKPTLFVAGNHEYYGSDLATAMAQLRVLSRGTAVRVLECGEQHHGGVRFLGCTLWSDHRLHESPEAEAEGLQQALVHVRDFSRIGVAPGLEERFTPALSRRLFDASVAWLDRMFAQRVQAPTVVVTHFAPSRRSIHARFAGSPINACFVSDLEPRILAWQPALWLHGHTHDSFDYRVGRTRVVANPRGYVIRGTVENASFDPSLVIALEPHGS